MPQLDKFSFSTQLFWFCIFFLIFYLILINQFLPNFLKILRFRRHRLFIFSSLMHQDIQEELLIKNSYISFLITQGAFMQTALLLLQKTFNIWRQI